jgi:hypothetical protein
MALIAMCRPCKHQRVLNPTNRIERFGQDCPAIACASVSFSASISAGAA